MFGRRSAGLLGLPAPLLRVRLLVGERFSAKDYLQGIQEDYRRGLEVTDFAQEIGTLAERCNALA
jgi:hypothetical protein